AQRPDPTGRLVESHKLTSRIGQMRNPTKRSERTRETTNRARRRRDQTRRTKMRDPILRPTRPGDLTIRASRLHDPSRQAVTTLDRTEPAIESTDVTRFQTGARRRGLCTWERPLMTGISETRKARSSPGITLFGPRIGGQPSGDAGSALTLKLAPTTTMNRPLVPTLRLN